MTNSNNLLANSAQALWLKSDIYLQNIDFWNRAWGMVKVPYTKMPNLPYLTSIPAELTKASAVRILDLGCGSGWLSMYLSRVGFYVTGIDLCEHAIQLARNWATDENSSARFDTGDILNVPYPNGSFDAIVANSIFEHLTFDLAQTCMSKLRQVLVPGGTIFGCFDLVGTGPGEYYKLEDGTHVYTDRTRQGMLLRCYSDQEIKELFKGWTIDIFDTIDSGSRIVWARS